MSYSYPCSTNTSASMLQRRFWTPAQHRWLEHVTKQCRYEIREYAQDEFTQATQAHAQAQAQAFT